MADSPEYKVAKVGDHFEVHPQEARLHPTFVIVAHKMTARTADELVGILNEYSVFTKD